jgi:hypothetical protein
MPRPQPHPLALFSLIPQNARAKDVVAHPCNSHLVSTLRNGTLALDIGFNIRSQSCNTLATLGRNGDIILEGSSIAKVQCSFEIDLDTNVVMLAAARSSGHHFPPFELHKQNRGCKRMQMYSFISLTPVEPLAYGESIWCFIQGKKGKTGKTGKPKPKNLYCTASAIVVWLVVHCPLEEVTSRQRIGHPHSGRVGAHSSTTVSPTATLAVYRVSTTSKLLIPLSILIVLPVVSSAVFLSVRPSLIAVGFGSSSQILGRGLSFRHDGGDGGRWKREKDGEGGKRREKKRESTRC